MWVCSARGMGGWGGQGRWKTGHCSSSSTLCAPPSPLCSSTKYKYKYKYKERQNIAAPAKTFYCFPFCLHMLMWIVQWTPVVHFTWSWYLGCASYIGLRCRSLSSQVPQLTWKSTKSRGWGTWLVIELHCIALHRYSYSCDLGWLLWHFGLWAERKGKMCRWLVVPGNVNGSCQR